MCVYVCLLLCVWACMPQCVCGGQGCLWGAGSLIPFNMGSEGWIQVIGFVLQALFPLSHLTSASQICNGNNAIIQNWFYLEIKRQ